MQKKLLKMMFVLSLIFVLPVHAACSYQEQAELNKEVANIKASYEIVTKTLEGWNIEEDKTGQVSYEAFRINVLNLSDKFYIKYSNNNNKDTKTLYSSNAVNGIISFDWEDLNKVTTMTFTVYSSDKTNCKNELYRTIYLTVPRYNSYSGYSICDNKEDYSICQKFVTFDEISEDEFMRRLASKNTNTPGEDIDTNTNTNTNNTIGGNYTVYIGIGVAVVVLVIVIVIIANRRRNKL